MTFPENKLVLAEGDSLSLTVLIEEDGAPKDLLGSTLFFSIKRSPNDNDRDALVRLQVPYIVGYPSGVFPLLASNAVMKRVRAGVYFYDLRLVKNGVVSTLAAASPLEVVPVITDNI
jgi:hypothetical protein